MFFSVKSTIKIMGKVYTPCVCYPATDLLMPTIEKLVKEERAYLFKEKVYFQNGKVIEKKSEVKENLTTDKPKKEKKAKALPVEEETPSPEEIADNEDF